MWHLFLCFLIAGWSSPVARQAHNLKVLGSNPSPAPRVYLCWFSSFFVALSDVGEYFLFQFFIEKTTCMVWLLWTIYLSYSRVFLIYEFYVIRFIFFVKFSRLWILHNAVPLFEVMFMPIYIFHKKFLLTSYLL